MSNHRLNKKEAIKLITPVIDGEVAEEQTRAFFRFIQDDREVHRCFEAEKRVKELLRLRLPRHRAPTRLRRRVKSLLSGYRLWRKGNNPISLSPNDGYGEE